MAQSESAHDKSGARRSTGDAHDAPPAHENPIDVNVVPMVDIIFCLCVFFMCSFHFRAQEGRFESWLPKDLGNGPTIAAEQPSMRVSLDWNEETGTIVHRFGLRVVQDEAELAALLAGAQADHSRSGLPERPLIVDAGESVPWQSVMGVLNLSKRLHIARCELARGR